MCVYVTVCESVCVCDICLWLCDVCGWLYVKVCVYCVWKYVCVKVWVCVTVY